MEVERYEALDREFEDLAKESGIRDLVYPQVRNGRFAK